MNCVRSTGMSRRTGNACKRRNRSGMPERTMPSLGLAAQNHRRIEPETILLCIVVLLLYCGLGWAENGHGERVDPEKLGGSEYCGHCHTDIFHQWTASTHHFSSFNNPVYRAVALDTIERKGLSTFAFCARCHDPILKASGELATLDTDNWQANAGITCLSCHRIVEIGGGNGHYRITEPFLHPFALSEDPRLAEVHKFLIRITPWLHRAVLTKDFYGSPEYCATCHSLSVPGSINGATSMAFSDEFGQLQRHHDRTPEDSLPEKCIECHMPEVPSNDPAARDGLIRSHRFAGSNTALPRFNRDFEQSAAIEGFLSSAIVALRVAGIRTRRDVPFQPVERVPVQPGDLIEIALEVSNIGAGHQFPTGTVDSNEAWLSMAVIDANGKTLAVQGQLDERGLVPENAVRFGTRFVDAFGNSTDRRNSTTDAVAVADDSVIPIRGRRTVFFDFKIPQDSSPPWLARFTLNWRKYHPEFIAWVFNGKNTPDLPITKIASLRIKLSSGTTVANRPEGAKP